MIKQDFIVQLERGASILQYFPVSSAVLRYLAQTLKSGEPEWWKLTQKAWERRTFGAWNDALSLFLAAMHYEALADAECPLVPYFPSCGGTDEADPAPGVAAFLPDAPDSFYNNLKTGELRGYARGRAHLWIPPAAIYFQTRLLPFYLVQVRAGAGLDLISDLSGTIKGLESNLVAARIGLDQPILDANDLAHRRWLTAALLPDDSGAVGQLDATIDLLHEGKLRDPNFVQMVECPSGKAARFIAKNIPADDEDVGLLVYNTGTTARMTDAEYKDYGSAIAETLKPWGERGLWVECERVRGEVYSTTDELRALLWTGGAPVQKVIARFDAMSPVSVAFEESARFLYPSNAELPFEDFLARARPK